MTPSVHHIYNAHGTRLALHRFTLHDKHDSSPIVLAHGTFSNYRSCRGLAEYLAKQGHDCWILDSQGHGLSRKPLCEPTFEAMALLDTDAVFDFISNQYRDLRLSWIGHSGGGLAILMYLARNRSARQRVSSITTIASQATDAGIGIMNRIKIHIASWVTRVCGIAPGKLIKIGPENEYARVMQQWFDWSLNGCWSGKDGFDYMAELANIQIPCLSLAAGNDHFIAPSSGCLKLNNAMGSKIKKFMVCGLSESFSEDYTHTRIIASRNASKEIWPLIAEWINHRSA